MTLGNSETSAAKRFSNKLSDAELERIAILSEEMGEALQCIGKIIRHGYASTNPVADTGRNNRAELERELGDVKYAVSLLVENCDLDQGHIDWRMADKAKKIGRYLHHQEI